MLKEKIKEEKRLMRNDMTAEPEKKKAAFEHEFKY